MMRSQVREFKRERVLEEATKLFYERGFQGSSIDAIADRLSVTKPFIYTYFDNKHALLEAIYERAVKNLNSGVDDIFSVDHPPEEQLRLLVEFYVRQNIESRELTAIFLNEERNLSAEKLAEIRAEQREFDRKLTALIRKGVKAGTFSVEDPAMASLSISGMVRWVHRWYAPEGRLDADQICRSLATLALRMVGYKEPARRARPGAAAAKKASPAPRAAAKKRAK